MGPFGIPEIIIILLVVMLIFGAKRLPEIGTSLGKSIRTF
ncbi:MAG TPA: twin-arginine translocase TatA/TatE family subunit, partial [Dehalococcoidia bacterium]|nr:twin-arginine translocase TatA/TatE family subunit [Dehalococcoidia bacterium]